MGWKQQLPKPHMLQSPACPESPSARQHLALPWLRAGHYFFGACFLAQEQGKREPGHGWVCGTRQGSGAGWQGAAATLTRGAPPQTQSYSQSFRAAQTHSDPRGKNQTVVRLPGSAVCGLAST